MDSFSWTRTPKAIENTMVLAYAFLKNSGQNVKIAVNI